MCNSQLNSPLRKCSIHKRVLVFAIIGLFFSTPLAHGQSITISDVFSINYNSGVSGTTDVAYVGLYAGENQFAYSINVEAGDSVAYTINATSVTGDPRMQILMYNPNNHSEYWWSSDIVDIGVGSNEIIWGQGGFSNNVHLKFMILLDSDDALTINSFVVTDSGDDSVTIDRSIGVLPTEYSNYYRPSNVVSSGSDNFTFGENLSTGEAISWKQEIDVTIHNDEIQQYKGGYVGTDSNGNLVLTIKRQASGAFHSSRVNTSIYDGIKVGVGEKLSVEFEAQLPVARDSNGNYVEDVPLWPALWLMGNDQLNGQWVGWPFCAEIDVMEWSPTKPPTIGTPLLGSHGGWGYQYQSNIAYHWNGEDVDSGYNHRQESSYYTKTDIHTKFHKWRVDIYRYADETTNKIEMFLDDVYISGSRFEENSAINNQEYWAPTIAKNPKHLTGSGDKEYFLIMNIAMGGDYPETSTVPDDFEYADMVIKDVTYEITSLGEIYYELNLNYDPTKVSVEKLSYFTEHPDGWPANATVLIKATALPGYVLSDNGWKSQGIHMYADRSFNIDVNQDTDDDDGDGVNNYQEAVIYNSNSDSADSDNDSSSDYFESIAGTSLTDPNDFFYLQGSMNLSGLYELEYASKSNRNYTIKVSDDLNHWYDWITESGTGSTRLHTFNPESLSNTGLNNNSGSFFFIIDIEQ